MSSAVRQTPLTATESPVERRLTRTDGAPIVIRVTPAFGVTQRIFPVVSMSPVNMGIGYRKRVIGWRVGV